MAIIEQKKVDSGAAGGMETRTIYAGGRTMELLVRKVGESQTGNIYEVHSVKEVEPRRRTI